MNFDGNHPYGRGPKSSYRKKTVPVASLPDNAWGLYEMHGNVWEWCADWYGAYRVGAQTDPEGRRDGDSRVVRGGSWIDLAPSCRSAFRHGLGPSYRTDVLGFRLAPGRARASAEPA